MKQLPNLLKQETSSISTYLSINGWIIKSKKSLEIKNQIISKILPLYKNLLEDFL